MPFPQQLLNEIRERLSLADIIGRDVKLQKRGREHLGLCPFHPEKTPSFTVAEDKGFFHCFGCGAHGDIFGYVMRVKGIPFPEAVRTLAEEVGIQLPEDRPSGLADRQEGLSPELPTIEGLGQEALASEGFVPSGAQQMIETIDDYARKLKTTSLELAKLDSAPGLPLEVTHNHVRGAAHSLSRVARQEQRGAWSIAGQVFEYIGTAIAAIGASHIKTGTEFNLWGIWAFGLGSIVAVVLLVIRLSRRRVE